MNDAERIIELLGEMLEKLGKTPLDDFHASIDKVTEGLTAEEKQVKINEILTKRINEEFTKFDKSLKGGRKTLIELGPVIDRVEEQFNEMSNSIEKSDLAVKRNNLATQYLTAQYKKAAADILKTTTNVLVGGVAKTTTAFVRSLQSNSSGVNIAGEVLTGVIDTAQSGFTAMTTAGTAVGTTLMSSTNPGLKRLGAVTTVASIGLEFLTSSLSKLAKFGVEILVKEVEKTIKSFHDISSTGAMFADGMTGIRGAAHNAGITVEQFSNVVKNNSESLYATGLGMGEAAKRIGNISKELRTGNASQLGIQLQNLGYGFEEQTEMIARYTARLAAANALRGKSDLELAQMTAQYAKDLRLLSAVTGEDAKKLAEDARLAALQSDILAQLDPDQARVFMAGFEALPKEARTAVLESVSSGGTAITDAASNLMMQQVPGFAQLVQDFTAQVFSGTVSDTEMREEILKQRALIGEEIRARLRAEGDAIGSANRLSQGLGGVGQAFVELRNSFIVSTQTTAEQTQKAIEARDAASGTADSMTNLINQAEATSQALKVAFEDRLTGSEGAITRFAKVTNGILDGLENAMKKAGFDVESGAKTTNSYDDFMDRWGQTLLGTGMLVGGGLLSMTGIGAGIGLPMLAGGLATTGALIAVENEASNLTGYAAGGIIHQPEIALMGEGNNSEAVVPLPDNRSIPVTMTNEHKIDTREITSAIQNQSAILNQILASMEKNNQLTSGILQTSY